VNELPGTNEKINIKDFSIGYFGSSSKVSLESCHTKVLHYQVYKKLSQTSKKRKFDDSYNYPVKVVVVNPKKIERAVEVSGGRVRGSCGAAYFAKNGKLFAFHVESLDDGDDVSLSNSITGRSHHSHSVGLVLCRLPKFLAWYNEHFHERLSFDSISNG
jgi:hypothetical protein